MNPPPPGPDFLSTALTVRNVYRNVPKHVTRVLFSYENFVTV